MSIETKGTEWRIVTLAAANNDTAKYLSDQNYAQFGTNRRSEIIGEIGDTGESFEELYDNKLTSL